MFFGKLSPQRIPGDRQCESNIEETKNSTLLVEDSI